MSNISWPLLAVAFTSAVAIAPAGATVALVPGSFVDLPGTTLGLEPNLTGTVLEDVVLPFSFAGGTVSGTVQSRVARLTNLGTLNFSWRVVTNEGSAPGINRLRLGEFGETSLAGDWRIDSLGDIGVDRALQLMFPFEDYVNFEFEEALGLGESSHFFYLTTNATDYDYGAFYDLTIPGGTFSESFPTFRPAAVTTPAPGMLALFGLGVLAVRLRRRAV